jgi:hypothetical protein
LVMFRRNCVTVVVDRASSARLHSNYPNMPHARSRMARFVSPAGISNASAEPLTDFYRQEFLKHRRCLAAQREYFSEGAISTADQALAKVLGQLDQLCAQDDADKLMSGLLRKFNAVTGLSGWLDPTQLH